MYTYIQIHVYMYIYVSLLRSLSILSQIVGDIVTSVLKDQQVSQDALELS